MKSELMNSILALAASPGGVALAEVGGGYLNAWRAANTLVDRGAIYRGRRSHKDVRFFSCAEDAARWSRTSTRPVARPASSLAAIDHSAQALYPKNADGSPAYKFTLVSTPAYCPPRYARASVRQNEACWP
jgi:hypothetical protein